MDSYSALEQATTRGKGVLVQVLVLLSKDLGDPRKKSLIGIRKVELLNQRSLLQRFPDLLNLFQRQVRREA